ncbi:phosphonopyruvate decarboxylase [Kibdelosporangium banguiense]|uniref:Phosphonopyruvate decarboxylase n=1 Tax=Kibdelosporangium banguiense TaxID=1365924 RepID=A0ABS4TZ37_9PSEU|nr:thiamine pyrophosphate-dependent enzyme [Kibdelosporangium banguiense]MBP2329258.1 phosphonopyruvate decarboxylase [Kibdelosporangium banguiense]
MTTMDVRVDRRRFVADLMARIPDALVVSGLGSATYDLCAAGERPGNFYLWGAMGGALPLALGLAVAQPDRSVVVITGDGEHLMGIGALGTVGAILPPNLTIVVLDNGHFGETGMQASHTSLGTDLITVAKGFGIRNVVPGNDIGALARHINGRKATTYAHVPINADEPPRVLPPRDGVAIKNAFRAALGFGTF